MASGEPFFLLGKTFLPTLGQPDIWTQNSLTRLPALSGLCHPRNGQTDRHLPGKSSQSDEFGRYSQPASLVFLGVPSCSFSDRGTDRQPPNKPIPLLPASPDRRTSARAILCYEAAYPGSRHLPAPPRWVPTEPAPSLSLYRAQFCPKGLSLGVIPPTPRPLPLPDSQIFSSLVLWASHLFVFVVQGASGIPTPTSIPTEPSSPRKPRSSCLERLPHEL